MKTAQTYVTCRVSRGFFSSEFYVKLKSGDAFIIDRSNLQLNHEPQTRTEEVDGKVLAYVIEQNPASLLIELPGEPVAGGLRSWVSREEADPLSQAA
ncbi:MAG: hypothetical protein IT168_07835 [Bryobacterales bacterium]|nr:hypothetical protein [Bryobacterales bacterium]